MIAGGGERDVNGRTGLTWNDVQDNGIKRTSETITLSNFRMRYAQ